MSDLTNKRGEEFDVELMINPAFWGRVDNNNALVVGVNKVFNEVFSYQSGKSLTDVLDGVFDLTPGVRSVTADVFAKFKQIITFAATRLADLHSKLISQGKQPGPPLETEETLRILGDEALLPWKLTSGQTQVVPYLRMDDDGLYLGADLQVVSDLLRTKSPSKQFTHVTMLLGFKFFTESSTTAFQGMLARGEQTLLAYYQDAVSSYRDYMHGFEKPLLRVKTYHQESLEHSDQKVRETLSKQVVATIDSVHTQAVAAQGRQKECTVFSLRIEVCDIADPYNLTWPNDPVVKIDGPEIEVNQRVVYFKTLLYNALYNADRNGDRSRGFRLAWNVGKMPTRIARALRAQAVGVLTPFGADDVVLVFHNFKKRSESQDNADAVSRGLGIIRQTATELGGRCHSVENDDEFCWFVVFPKVHPDTNRRQKP